MPKAQLVALPKQQPQFPKGEGYNALVEGQWVRTAPNKQQPIRMYTRDSLAPRSDDTGSVYENTLDLGQAFVRADFTGGEGLDWSPRQLTRLAGEAAIDQTKYWDSANINISPPRQRGDLYTIQLSGLLEIWHNQAGLVDLATSDNYIYVAFDALVQWWDDWGAVVPVDSKATSGTIAKIVASPTGDICALLADGTVEESINDAAFVPVTGLTGLATNIWYAKGRFIVEDDDGAGNAVLREIAGAAASDPFDTYRGTCHSIVSSGPAIVGALSDGTLRSYVPEQANQEDPTSVNLVIRGRTQVPEGEVPYLLGSNAAVLIVLTRATNEGVDNTIRAYQAEVLDGRFDYIVGQLQSIREWVGAGDTIDIRQNMATTRDEIFWMVQETPAEDSVWRYDLVTAGLSRHIAQTQLSTGLSLIVFDERAAMVSATNIWYSGDLFVDEGYMIFPNVNFGVNTDISWLATTIRALGIVAGGKQIELYYSTDPTAITEPDVGPSGKWKIASRISAPGQEEVEELLTNVTARSLALQLRIYASAGGTSTPKVSRVAVRGIPSQRDWILELPINVSDIVEVPGRMPLTIPELGDSLHRSMLDKAGRSLTIDVLDPPFLFTGIIDSILEPTEYVSDRGSSSVRIVLQCRGSQRDVTISSVGDAGLGLGLLGVETLGIGQTDRT